VLATDLLLLALDDDRGTVHSRAAMALDFGLAGAVTMELALQGAIRMEGPVISAATASVDDPILNDALTAIANAPGTQLRHWIGRPQRLVKDLRQRLLDVLVAQGTLEKREKRILLVFHHDVYPERNDQVEHDIRARLDAVLLHGERPDARTTCLIHLAAACRIPNVLYAARDLQTVKSRIAELSDIEQAGVDAVTSAVASAQAAAVAAAMAGAIAAATVAATSAACSSAAAACT
jgi:hypothetical protein